jgi:hypothetical protein
MHGIIGIIDTNQSFKENIAWMDIPGSLFMLHMVQILGKSISRPEYNKTITTLKSKPQLTCCEYRGRPDKTIWIYYSLSSCF